MEDTTPGPVKPKRAKFKYTRELIRIAIQDGMTQREIADLCRVEQSVVSGWLHGKGLAGEHQVVELRKRYGGRLNRTTSRVYLVRTSPATPPRWEESERGRELLAVSEAGDAWDAQGHITTSTDDDDDDTDRLDDFDFGPTMTRRPWPDDLQARFATLHAAVLPGVNGAVGLDTLIAIDREEFEASTHPLVVTYVEGPIVLRHTFAEPRLEIRGREAVLVRTAAARWIVHHQGRDRFVLVRQEPIRLVGAARWRWERTLDRLQSDHDCGDDSRTARDRWRKSRRLPVVECADDAGRWVSEVLGPVDAGALLAFCEGYLRDPAARHDPHDEMALPFLLRKKLVELGYDLPGVARLMSEG